MWLNPDPANLAAQYSILDHRDRPYYEHRMQPDRCSPLVLKLAAGRCRLAASVLQLDDE